MWGIGLGSTRHGLSVAAEVVRDVPRASAVVSVGNTQCCCDLNMPASRKAAPEMAVALIKRNPMTATSGAKRGV
jgi:hypothetical protein